ncbi:MAG: T9SS type A sorting domain-containing protein, partial [Bacteroidales bacterium]|nr:T9SS type A sorting domain-containing protein [Bacteroidales bacterium]
IILPDISNNNNHGTLFNMEPANDWITSTAPIPYNSIADGNWDVDNTWNIGQMAPINDWARVIVDHNVHMNQDQTLKTLIINSGALLTVDAGYDLTMDGVLTNAAGTSGFVVQANATGMGSVIQDSPGVDATVQEYITSERWHLVSPPVANSTINTYFDIYLKEWDEPTRSWTYLVDPVTLPLNVAQGYSAWADNIYTGTTTVDFTGTLNTGDYTLSSLDYTVIGGNSEEGFNLVGNPYPSAIDWNTNWNITNLSGWAIIYDNGVYRGWNTYLTGMDRSYNGKLDGIIPSTQGFWLRAIGGGASVTIPASERVHDAQAFYKDSEESIYAGIRLQVSTNEFTDDAVILLHPEGTSEFDGLYDLAQFENIPEAPQLYSIMSDGNYAVNVISENTEEAVIAIGFKTGQAGTYEITTASMSNFSNNMTMVLEDIKLDILTELKEGISYEFDFDLMDNEHRFNLHFKDAAIDDEKGYLDIHIYSFNDQVYIQTPELESAEVVIFDIMGQEILREQTSSTGYSVLKITTGTGYYLVKLITNDRIITEKVFIK